MDVCGDVLGALVAHRDTSQRLLTELVCLALPSEYLILQGLLDRRRYGCTSTHFHLKTFF
jgi:hypothetical protein